MISFSPLPSRCDLLIVGSTELVATSMISDSQFSGPGRKGEHDEGPVPLPVGLRFVVCAVYERDVVGIEVIDQILAGIATNFSNTQQQDLFVGNICYFFPDVLNGGKGNRNGSTAEVGLVLNCF